MKIRAEICFFEEDCGENIEHVEDDEGGVVFVEDRVADKV